MFANTFQSGFVSIFYSVGSNPLQIWDKEVKNGHIRRVVDDEVRSLVLEVSGTNVATTYITCPVKPRQSLGIKLPFLVMIIKNMKKYFTFEIQILDDKDMHRRFRVSNFQSTTKVRPFCTTMPIGLSSGWNQVQFNLADFTKRAYGSTYLETTRVQIHANVRIRRIYFSDVLYSDEDLPNEYKLFIPAAGKAARGSKTEDASRKVSKKFSTEEDKIAVAEEELPLPSPMPPSIPEEEEALPEEKLSDIEGDTMPTTPSEPPLDFNDELEEFLEASDLPIEFDEFSPNAEPTTPASEVAGDVRVVPVEEAAAGEPAPGALEEVTTADQSAPTDAPAPEAPAGDTGDVSVEPAPEAGGEVVPEPVPETPAVEELEKPAEAPVEVPETSQAGEGGGE